MAISRKALTPGVSRRLGRGLLLVAAGLALAYATALGWIYLEQEKLLFLGEPLPADRPIVSDGDVHELTIPVPGANLSALQLKLPKPAGVVFFLHGNKGNLSTWFVNLDLYRRANYDLFMVDYRGYGKSSGSISSEAQLQADVAAAWGVLAAQYPGKPIVIYGRSLGTDLAAHLAARVRPALTVLVSPYCSMSEVAAAQYPWVPSMLLKYPLNTCAEVAAIDGPLVLIHGAADSLIPLRHSEEIRQRQPAARLYVIPGAGHSDINRFPAYLDVLNRELAAAAR